MSETITKVFIYGLSGRMGQEINKIFDDQAPKNLKLIGGSTSKTSESELINRLAESDVVIDFSTTTATLKLFELIKSQNIRNKKVLLCTTGLSEKDLDFIREITASQQLATLRAANTSVGVLMLYKTAMKAAQFLFNYGFDIELVETHHKHKQDAPSGTAKLIADALAEQTKAQLADMHPRSEKRQENVIGVHAVRGGGVYGEHEVRFISEFEEFTISHRALSRTLFAKGAIVLANVIAKKPANFYEYGDLEMEDLN